MSQQGKLLIAAVILTDLILLLVWILRETPAGSTFATSLEVEHESSRENGMRSERPSAPASAVAAGRSPASVTAPSAKRASVLVPARIQVRGTVYGLDSRALLGLEVHLLARDGRGIVVQTTANSRADFYLEDLHAGEWTLLARAEGYVEFRSKLELRADENVHQVDIELQRLDELRIRMITPEGGSLVERMEADGGRLEVAPFTTPTAPGARLTEAQAHRLELTCQQLWHPPVSHADSVNGFGSDVEGHLLLSEPLPCFVSVVFGDAVLQTKYAAFDAVEVTFVLSLGDVRSTWSRVQLELVESETGKPIENAEANLDSVMDQSDGRGAVQFENICSGVHRLQVHAPGHEDVSRSVRVEPGGVNDLGTWRLAAETSIRGRVCDADGNGVVIRLSVLSAAEVGPLSTDALPRIYSENRTDGLGAVQSGVFCASGLGRRKYWLRANDEKLYAPPALVDTSGGSVKDVVIRVSLAVPVSLRFENDEARYVKFAIADRDGAPVREGGTVGDTARVSLGPGSYSVRYQVGDDAPVKRSFEVGTQGFEIGLGR